MGKHKNFTNERFGRLLVVEKTAEREHGGSVVWKCICDCGREALVPTHRLSGGLALECPRCSRQQLDLTGQRFGKLDVIGRSDQQNSEGKYKWECRCDCGGTTFVLSQKLTSGAKKSCGCLNQMTDLAGQRFGKLVVEKYGKKTSNGHYWECVCDCGNRKSILGQSLTRGTTKSCGCNSVLDLTGQRFGRLLVIARTKNKRSGRTAWTVQCDCGVIKDIATDTLTSGTVNSCGCLRSEKSRKRFHDNLPDLTGKKFSCLTVLGYSGRQDKYGNRLWNCQCECGNMTIVITGYLNNGGVKSCGCLVRTKQNLEDITGNKYGRLTVLEFSAQMIETRQRLWRCACECGNTILTTTGRLKRGIVKSCGYIPRELLQSYIIEDTSLYKAKYERATVNSQSGILGVFPSGKRWIAHMQFQGKIVLHESFATIEEATAARKEAEETYHTPLLKEYNLLPEGTENA